MHFESWFYKYTAFTICFQHSLKLTQLWKVSSQYVKNILREKEANEVLVKDNVSVF